MTDTTTRSRWAVPAVVAGAMTEEQAQRIHSLRAAREVLENQKGGGPFTGSTRDQVDADDLIRLAIYVTDGAAGVLVYDSSRDDAMLRYKTIDAAIPEPS